MGQFAATLDRWGDFHIAGGWVIPTRSGQSPTYVASQSTEARGGPSANANGDRTFSGFENRVFVGGSGRNIQVTNQPNTLTPCGYFKPGALRQWDGTLYPSSRVEMNPDGSATISDGTDVLAEAPAGTFLTTSVPEAPFPLDSTTYGADTYNGGVPFTLMAARESGSLTWPKITSQPIAGTALADNWTASDADNWTADTDPSWTIAIDGTGLAQISDGTDVVAERQGNVHDPVGHYVATAYGEATYNGGEGFTIYMGQELTLPIACWVWVVITSAAPPAVDAVSGPFKGAAVPAPAGDDYPIPIAWSDGAGGIFQVQEGPIYWA